MTGVADVGDVPLSGGCSPHRIGQRGGDYDAISAGCATTSNVRVSVAADVIRTCDGASGWLTPAFGYR
jgi:hypothetical protein